MFQTQSVCLCVCSDDKWTEGWSDRQTDRQTEKDRQAK